jgi:hypothetical protein
MPSLTCLGESYCAGGGDLLLEGPLLRGDDGLGLPVLSYRGSGEPSIGESVIFGVSMIWDLKRLGLKPGGRTLEFLEACSSECPFLESEPRLGSPSTYSGVLISSNRPSTIFRFFSSINAIGSSGLVPG